MIEISFNISLHLFGNKLLNTVESELPIIYFENISLVNSKLYFFKIIDQTSKYMSSVNTNVPSRSNKNK